MTTRKLKRADPFTLKAKKNAAAKQKCQATFEGMWKCASRNCSMIQSTIDNLRDGSPTNNIRKQTSHICGAYTNNDVNKQLN